MFMRYIVSRFLIVCLVFFLSIQQSFSWAGLVAQTGDILDTIKWNEMVDELNQKLESTNIIAGTGVTVDTNGSDVTISTH